jgi:hypothetical protein
VSAEWIEFASEKSLVVTLVASLRYRVRPRDDMVVLLAAEDRESVTSAPADRVCSTWESCRLTTQKRLRNAEAELHAGHLLNEQQV